MIDDITIEYKYFSEKGTAMSTIRNMIGANHTPPTRNLSEDEKTERQEAQAARLANVQSGMSGLLGGIGKTDNNQTGFDFFAGAGSSMATLKTINTARTGIENRARTLLSEIRMDQLRGVDTSHKRELLGNLTGNLEVMNKNLGSNIDKAMTPGEARKSNQPSIIERINADLKKISEQEAKKIQARYGKKEEPSAPATDTAKAPETPAATPEKSE